MTVLIRNPSDSPVTLPFPFRGVIPAGGGIPIELSIDLVRDALGSVAKDLNLLEVGGPGDLFARGLYSRVIALPDAAKTLAAQDANMQFRCALGCVFTVPKDLPFIPGETEIIATQLHATQQVSFVAGVGVTINTSSSLLSQKQFSSFGIVCVGPNEYDVFGDQA